MTSKEALESVREARQRLMDDWKTMTPEQIREELQQARRENLARTGQETAEPSTEELPLVVLCKTSTRVG